MPKKKKLIRYSSNNSGGRWWLDDDDWKRLEQNGWSIEWAKNCKYRSGDKDGRWLGALATACTKKFYSVLEAAAEFSRITGQSMDEEGCPCCGPPHYFSEEREDGVD